MSLTKIKKILTSIAVILVFVIILTGCAPAEQPSDEQLPDVAAPTRIIIADAPTTHHLNLYVAKEKGIFERYGLDVEIRTVESLAAARDSVVTGAADVFWSCPTVAIAAIAGGAPIRTIAQVKIPCTSVLLVPADSSIQNYSDLEGKTIAGISPSCEAVIAITNAAEEAGVEFNLVTMAGGPAIAALEAGQIDGAILEEPHASIAELKGFRVMFREAAEAIPCRTINARTGFIAQNADALRDMIKAIDEANALINANPTAEDIVEIAHVPTGAPKEAIILGNPRLLFTTQLDEEGLCKLSDELVEMGHIEECPADFMFAPEFRGITWD
jgi:NitT/TauT family transport system substrate-binding protein